MPFEKWKPFLDDGTPLNGLSKRSLSIGLMNNPHAPGPAPGRKEKTMNDVCKWKYDEITGAWETSCDNLFSFLADGPVENNFKFCPYCGREICEQK
jgi:hypothetical protein